MGVVIEICVKCPGGPTRNRGADIIMPPRLVARGIVGILILA
jgi:hypothetical protein